MVLVWECRGLWTESQVVVSLGFGSLVALLGMRMQGCGSVAEGRLCLGVAEVAY